MQKIENFAQISNLLNAQLKRGVLTNNFLRGDDYTREIANGLYIHEADGALLLIPRTRRPPCDDVLSASERGAFPAGDGQAGYDRAVLPRQGRGRDGQCRRAVLRSRFS